MVVVGGQYKHYFDADLMEQWPKGYDAEFTFHIPVILGSKPLHSSKADSVFYPSEVNTMSIWGLLVKVIYLSAMALVVMK